MSWGESHLSPARAAGIIPRICIPSEIPFVFYITLRIKAGIIRAPVSMSYFYDAYYSLIIIVLKRAR